MLNDTNENVEPSNKSGIEEAQEIRRQLENVARSDLPFAEDAQRALDQLPDSDQSHADPEPTDRPDGVAGVGSDLETEPDKLDQLDELLEDPDVRNALRDRLADE